MRWAWVFFVAAGCDGKGLAGRAERTPPRPVAAKSATTSTDAPARLATNRTPTSRPRGTSPPTSRAPVIPPTASATVAPFAWGPRVPGVVRRLPPAEEPRVALTFDACGGPGGDGYDAELIALLQRERVPATLFLTARWIGANAEAARALAAEPLFELQNHGAQHRPCTVTGRQAFGIAGPEDDAAARAEIVGGREAIAELTGKAARFYRPGTGYFEPACVELVRELGALPMGFSVAGDAGGSFTRARMARTIGEAPSGAIVLLHMNQPERDIAEAVEDALPRLRERGVKLVQLTEVFSKAHATSGG